MNAAEKLAREISRVTALRCQYESVLPVLGQRVNPAIDMMNAALEKAFFAAGVDNALPQLNALKELEGFKE